MRLSRPYKREDLRPVGVLGARGLVVDRRDRRLQLIRADRAPRQRRGDERDAFGDGFAIPERAILLVERDQLAVRSGPRRAAGIGQQHQRQQSGDLAVVRQQAVDGARQPDRLVRQIGCAAGRARCCSRSPR